MPTISQIHPPLPRSALLRWLMDAGPDVPLHIRSLFLSEMVSAPKASLAGPLSGVMINVTAICLHAGKQFQVFLGLELLLLAIRLTLLRRAARNTARGIVTPPDFYLILVISWFSLQGGMGFASIISGIRAMQILVATSLMALIGPTGARNYGAPRYANLLISLFVLPLVAGAQLIHEPLLLVMVLQMPLLFVGFSTILNRYRSLSLKALLAQEDSLQRALHDSLTGLTNRAGLAHSLAKYDATRQPFVIFYIDLDGFKPVNDTFGHWAGDLVLAEVSERLRSCSRKTDIIARLGGDEFVFVTPGMLPNKSDLFAERLIRVIADKPSVLETAGPIWVGASVGFACAPDDGIEIDKLQRKADAALYAAKHAGKGVGRRCDQLPDTGLDLATDQIVPVRS